MQWLVDIIVGVVALIAAVALSQFGLDLDAPRKSEREVHRVRDCDRGGALMASADREQNC